MVKLQLYVYIYYTHCKRILSKCGYAVKIEIE